jgi:uncharacterized membrane protein YbaN (DUF454 family)
MPNENPYRTEYERHRPQSTGLLIRARDSQDSPHWSAKMLALILLLLCVALGMVGLILPVIPGLLFLAIAVMIAASLFPALGHRVRGTPWLARFMTPYLDSASGFSKLHWRGKLRFMLWLTVKVFVDSFVLLWVALTRIVDFVRRDPV